MPIVKIDKVGFSESGFVADGCRWAAPTLLAWCNEKKYPIFKMPLACVNTSNCAWSIKTLDDFIWHCKRVNESDLKHPIILDNYGRIADGCHRCCKAILEGKTEIDAIRIEVMPDPDATNITE